MEYISWLVKKDSCKQSKLHMDRAMKEAEKSARCGVQCAKDRMKQGKDYIVNTAGSAYEGGKETIYNAYEGGKDTIYDAYEGGKEKVSGAYDESKRKIVDTYEDGKDKLSGAYEEGKDKVFGAYEAGKDTIYGTYEDGKDKIYGTYEDGKDKIYGTYEDGKDKVYGTYEDGKDKICDAYVFGKDKATDKYCEALYAGRHRVRNAYHQAYDSVAGVGYNGQHIISGPGNLPNPAQVYGIVALVLLLLNYFASRRRLTTLATVTVTKNNADVKEESEVIQDSSPDAEDLTGLFAVFISVASPIEHGIVIHLAYIPVLAGLVWQLMGKVLNNAWEGRQMATIGLCAGSAILALGLFQI